MRRPPHANDPSRRVVILGGGFGGLAAARALRRAPVEITLVATGTLSGAEIAPLLRHQRNARVLLAEVTNIDFDARALAVTGQDGETLELPYDSLIVAAGAGVDAAGRRVASPGAPSHEALKGRTYNVTVNI